MTNYKFDNYSNSYYENIKFCQQKMCDVSCTRGESLLMAVLNVTK